MSVVYLLRHGQASFGAENYDVLSAGGIQQSKVAGKELARRDVVVAAAHCGTLQRQRDTSAAALAECAPGMVAVRDARFNEYDFADIVAHHGAPADADMTDPRAYQRALDAALLDWMAAGDSSPCARRWPEFSGDARAALDEVVAGLGKGKQAVITTSGGIIATLCADLLGAPAETVPALNRVAVNAGLTKLISGRAGTTLVSFNEHGHFDGEAASLLSYR